MLKEDEFEIKDCTVVAAYKGLKFEVKLPNMDKTIMCTLSGKLKHNFIRVLVGDTVHVVMSAVDPTKGRIIWRVR